MDVCTGKSQVLGRKPVAYLTCNGSPPVGDTPSLMTFREVRLFYARAVGANGRGVAYTGSEHQSCATGRPPVGDTPSLRTFREVSEATKALLTIADSDA
jgi:hypothetical protein